LTALHMTFRGHMLLQAISYIQDPVSYCSIPLRDPVICLGEPTGFVIWVCDQVTGSFRIRCCGAVRGGRKLCLWSRYLKTIREGVAALCEETVRFAM
jgi:hypothetical protein